VLVVTEVTMDMEERHVEEIDKGAKQGRRVVQLTLD